MISTYELLTVYALFISAVSFLGGLYATKIHLSHRKNQLVLCFVAGFLLGIAVFHLIPQGIESLEDEESIEIFMFWLIAGVMITLILLRAFPSLSPDPTAMENSPKFLSKSYSWIGIAIGLSIHSVFEGIALGTSLLSSVGVWLVGFGVFVAIVLHKPLDAMSLMVTMGQSNTSLSVRRLSNIGFALVCPVSAFLTLWLFGLMGAVADQIAGRLIAVISGAFICIALSDLIPEAHFQKHNKIQLSMSFVAGVLLTYGFFLLEEITMGR